MTSTLVLCQYVNLCGKLLGFNDCPIIKGSALRALEDPKSEWGDKIMELMDTVDSYIPDPERATDKPFLMPIEDIFTITGRGTVATGMNQLDCHLYIIARHTHICTSR